MGVIHKAKVDWWIAASVLLGLVVPVFTALKSDNHWTYGIVAALWISVFAFCFPQSYATTAEALVIRAGLFYRRSIPYPSITAVRPSSDSRSSLALSLDRVKIEYAAGEVLIAPKDQAAFFIDLATRAPQLTRRGQDLVVSWT